jgi:hypothetical protein
MVNIALLVTTDKKLVIPCPTFASGIQVATGEDVSPPVYW